MKVISQKTIEVNKDLKLIVGEQQDDIRYFKEHCYIDDEDELQEITAPRNPMKKYGCVCDMYLTFAIEIG